MVYVVKLEVAKKRNNQASNCGFLIGSLMVASTQSSGCDFHERKIRKSRS